ncbi:pilus assembly protein PilQ [Lamprobacter modestohalophilus]|uniref:Pilus assembly protein PilQ n=2 Tax=Lamprobacter modestohalophilus TaxID=1064514 RepID=A0A9X0WA98_9GAMM|nr:pilus assembly protein PilQ [Lamprobacter modestohalophilus]MCF7976605.1 type IV pilus secretin PilQ [Chromatiaceae bacterium]
MLFVSVTPALGASLEVAEFATLPGNQVEIDLVFSGVPPTPSDFATENPARIAIDFPGASSQLGRKSIPIGLGVAHSLVAIEASDRTRVVVNLTDSVPYTIKTEGSRVRIALNPESVAPAPLARARRDSLDSSFAARSAGPVKDIDFRRGADGEGRVIISLPSAQTRVNVTEEGRDVIVGISNATLPQRLFRRLDVVDFGTPVVAVESRSQGSNVRVDIQTTDEFDYLAYQTENLFTIEFRSLTQAEKEQLAREKIVFSGDRLSLNFQDIEVRAVLQLLADFTGLNLVASDTVSGSITLRLKEVPWDQALDIILKTKGLAMRQSGNVIMVAPAAELAERETFELEAQQQMKELAPLKTEFVQVNYAKAGDIAELLEGQREQTAEVAQIGNMETVHRVSSQRVAPMLSSRGSVSFDPRTNALIIEDTAERLGAIRALITRLDVPVRQVLIESRVVIASNSFARDLGVRFGVSGSTGSSSGNQLLVGGGQDPGDGGIEGLGNFDAGPYGFDLEASAPFNSIIQNDEGAPNLWVNLPAPDPAGAVNFLLGKVGSHLITLELSAMQREGRGEVISSPRIVTADQTKAEIEVGQDIPVVTPATAESPATVRYEPATLKLDVTPHITPDDRVIMDLKVNKDEADFTFTVDGNPLRNRRAVSTSVLVDNGETIVLGGVYEATKDFNEEKVPWLGDLPMVGRLFKTTAKSETNQELLIFVTPKILKSDLAIR